MKVIKLFHKRLGLIEEIFLRNSWDEEIIRNDWYEQFRFINPYRRRMYFMIVCDNGIINPFTGSQKLGLSKYDLVCSQTKITTIITQKYNREVVLTDFIKLAKETTKDSFKIYLTENGIKSVLIDSNKDKEFINLLYEDSRQA